MPSVLLNLRDTARALGISQRALQRDLEQGLQPAKKGGRGRGNADLFDVDQVRAWRAARSVPDVQKLIERIERLPGLVAAQLTSTYHRAGRDKELARQYLAALAHMIVLDIADEFAELLPEVEFRMPKQIRQLRGGF